MENQFGNQFHNDVVVSPQEPHTLTENHSSTSATARPLTAADVDEIGRAMDALPARQEFDAKAQLLRLRPSLIRMKRKGYDTPAIVDWLKARGIQTSVSSVARATATAAQSVKRRPGQ